MANVFDSENPNVISQNTGFGGQNPPNAKVHIGPSNGKSNSAPLKLTPGTLLSTPEDGTIEYDGSNIYSTIGSTRNPLNGGGSLPFLNVLNFGAVGNGTTDDTVAINAAFSAATVAGGAIVVFPAGKNFLISSPLIIGSNTMVYAKLATITEAVGANCNILQTSSTTANRSFSNAVLNGTNVMTSVSGNFTSADIGSTVILGGGLAGGQKLVTTIASINSSTSVNLVKAATQSLTTTCQIHRRNNNIEIFGGSWLRGSNGPAFTIQIYHSDNVYIHDVFMSSSAPAGAFNLVFADCTDFETNNISVISTQFGNDGIHLEGPCTNFSIKNTIGNTGDDIVGLTAADYAPTYTVGDITNGTIRDTFSQGALCCVKLVGGTSLVLRGIHVDGCYGNTVQNGVAVWTDNTGDTDIDDVLIENIDVQPASPYNMIDFRASAVKSIKFRNLTYRSTTNTSGNVVSMYSSGGGNLNIQHIEIDGLIMENNCSSSGMINFITGTINNLRLTKLRILNPAVTGTVLNLTNGTATMDSIVIDDARVYSPSGTGTTILKNDSGVTSLQLNDIYLNGGGRVLNNTSNAATMNLLANNITLQSAYEFGVISSTTNMVLTNLSVNVTQSDIVSLVGAGAIVSVSGKGLLNPNNTPFFIRDGSQTPRIIHPEMQVDLSTVAKNNGDTAYNTNPTAGGSSIGVGVALSNGSNWKNIYSGNVY